MNKELKCIKELELKLLNPTIRENTDEIANLIEESFREFSKSGKVYNKEDLINHLPKESGKRVFKTEDWEVMNLSDDVVLVNFVSSESDDNFEQKTLRTSIWVKNEIGWQMVFHQGTKKN